MLIILQSGAKQDIIDRVVERIEQLGLHAHVSQGQFRTIIGAIGEENPVYLDQFRTIDGVENVVSIMKPYKLASRDFQKEDSEVIVGSVKIGAGSFVSIAGPCAVEDFKTTFETAKAVKEAGANMLRGGAFKPRTSPYSFQGLGEDGLKILRDCATQFDMPFVTEITDPRNVELVCQYADMLQVGARNMQNFVLLSEIGKTNMPVLLKRGPSNTVKDWLMSAEYILSGGNNQVVLCERGSQGFESEMRYTLDVGAIALSKIDSHLPVVVDPSHAAGRRDIVIPLAMAGIAAGADGLIVEVHTCPDHAQCDGPQALMPNMFQELMKQIKEIKNIASKQIP